MKSSLIALTTILWALSMPTHAQDGTTKQVHSDIQTILAKGGQSPDSKTLARVSATAGKIYGEYFALASISTSEQGHQLSCIPETPDMIRILKDVSHAIETDQSLDKDSDAGIMEALMSAYPCLIPQTLKNRAMEGKP